MRVLIILVVLLGLTACSKKSASVKLELTSSFVFGGSTAMQGVSEGGLMVWGISTDGDSFSRVLSDSDAIALDVPNGTWTFSAVAWDSSDATVLDNEDLRCARSEPMKLAGDEVKVSLSLDRNNCINADFRGGITTQTSLNLVMCQSVGGILSATDKCTYDAADPNRVVDKAPVGSVLVRMVEFDGFGKNISKTGQGLSRCVATTSTLSGDWQIPGDLTIPVGDPTKPGENPFRMELEFYWNSLTCAGGTASNTLALPQGLVSPGVQFFPQAGAHVAFVPAPDSLVCSGRESLASFPGGNGTKERPWVICSAKQLYKIFSNNSYLVDSFRLAADIDLNPFTKGLTAVAPTEWPASAASWEEGQNWQPIGYDGASYTLVTNGFRGSFFGGGHRIKGMRARMNASRVGFIGEWDTVTAGHSVTGLVFENLEIGGNAYVGGVVGLMEGSQNGLLANIEVRGGEVTAGEVTNVSSVGGILGNGINSNLLNLKTSRVKIEGEGNYIGGIFGFISDTEILHKLVSRSYVGGPDWAAPRFVGGIGGQLGSASLLSGRFGEWASESIVVGKENVGGLLGFWSGTTNAGNSILENVYAAGSVSIRGTNANSMGGLFGTNSNTAVLSKAYYAGSLLNDSSAANCGSTCHIGWISGNAVAMALTSVFVAHEDDGTHFSLLPRSGNGDNAQTYSLTQRQPHIAVAPSIYETSPMSALPASAWVHAAGDKPRLIFEKHPCSQIADSDGISPRLSLNLQKAKWGTATKPMMICRKDQFAELSTELASGKIGVIVGALNLGSSAVHVPPNLVSGAYLTGEGGYIHGLRRIEGGGSVISWAPFNTISGILKHLLIAGVELENTSGALTGSSINGLALANAGYVEDVKFLTGKLKQNISNVVLSGLTETNSGTLKDVRFEGTLVGAGEIAGLVTNNSNSIQDAEASGTLILASAGNDIAGVVGTNSGTVARVSVTSKFMGNSFNSNYLGMVAVTNSGTIQDVHITTEANWLGRYGAEVSQVVVTQTGGTSVLKRIIAEGFLHDVQNTTTAPNGDLNFNKFPAGTMRSIYTVPAGRLIAEASPAQIASCTSGNVLTMQNTLTVPSAFASYWQSGMVAANKIVWVLFDDGDGKVNYAYITNAAYPALVATLSQNCAFLQFTATTRIRFLQDFNTTLAGATGDNSLTPFVGFNPNNPQRYSASTLLGLDWNEDIPLAPVANSVIARGTPGQDWILDIMGEFLGVTSTVTPKPIWEVDGDERIELFKIKK